MKKNALIQQWETTYPQCEAPPGGWHQYLKKCPPNLFRQRYKRYQRSGVWEMRRNGALQRAGDKCVICRDKKALEVHHVTYERIGKEMPEDLRVLCRLCHCTVHATGQTNIPMDKVTRKAAELRYLKAAGITPLSES